MSLPDLLSLQSAVVVFCLCAPIFLNDLLTVVVPMMVLAIKGQSGVPSSVDPDFHHWGCLAGPAVHRLVEHRFYYFCRSVAVNLLNEPS